jgi:hypothetical protein
MYDNGMPYIAHDPGNVPEVTVDNSGNATPNISIVAYASDVGPAGIMSLKLEYRQVGSKYAIPSADYSNPSVASSIQIPSGLFSSAQKAIGVDYRLVAVDSATNTISTSWYSISVRNAPSVVITTPTPLPGASSYPSTELVKAYRIFSVPYDLDDKTPGFVATSLGPHNGNNTDYYNWRLQRYINGNKQDYEQFANDASAFAPGRGFFLIVRDPQKTVTVGANRVVRAADMYNIGIQLSDGWNLVGTPLNTNIPFDSLIFVGGTYTDRAYFDGDGPVSGWWKNGASVNTMKPWDGMAIRVSGTTTLKFQMQGPQLRVQDGEKVEATGREILAKQAIEAKEQPDWFIPIDAYRSDIGMKCEGNGIGMAKNANDGADKFDSYMPPLIGDRNVALLFDNPDGAMMKDIRPTNTEGGSWDMRVITGDASANVTLKFSDIAKISNLSFSAYLFDLDEKSAHELKENPVLDINSGNGIRSFRLVVGKKEYIETNNGGIELAPSTLKLYANFPNPFNPETSIRYNIPNSAPSFLVTVKIFNVLGQDIATIVNKHQSPGYYEVKWRATTESSGVYFYQVMISDGKKMMQEMRKMVLMK